MARRILRGAIKVTAGCAGVVFLLDNNLTDRGLTVMLGCVAVLFACGLIWLIFGLSEDTGFWPKNGE